MVGVKCWGKNRKTWGECVDNDMKCLVCGLRGQFSGICGGTLYGQTSNPSLAWKKFRNKL